MGLPGALQCRIFSPRGGKVSSWSLPVWMIGSCSYTVMMGLGIEGACVVIHARVARAMNIQDGAEVEFELIQAGERFTQQVVVKDNIPADVIVHGAGYLRIAESESTYVSISSPTSSTPSPPSSSTLTLYSGKELDLPHQEIWAGLKRTSMEGSAVLFFDGASRDNPNGPSGYGYHLMNEKGNGELIRGYGYFESGTSNQMEYEGLIEGLTWACRLDLGSLRICGDSELVIRQCNNEYHVRDEILASYHKKVTELLKKARKAGTKVVLQHIPRERNIRADSLANLGIDSKGHLTACHWGNINKLCRRT